METKIIQIIASESGQVAGLDAHGNVWILNTVRTPPQWDMFVPHGRERIRDVST